MEGNFIVSVNVGGGSMAEAMWPWAIYGPFKSKADAKTFEAAFYKACSDKSKELESQMLTTVKEVTEPCYIDAGDPRLKDMDLDGKKVIDCMLTAEMLFKDSYWEEEE